MAKKISGSVGKGGKYRPERTTQIGIPNDETEFGPLERRKLVDMGMSSLGVQALIGGKIPSGAHDEKIVIRLAALALSQAAATQSGEVISMNFDGKEKRVME